MIARRRETATLIARARRVLRKSRKLFERREVQLKQPQQPLERNPEIARKMSGNHRTQSEERGLRSVTARFSLRCEEEKTQNLPREALGRRSRIIKRQTKAKKNGKKAKAKEDKLAKRNSSGAVDLQAQP